MRYSIEYLEGHRNYILIQLKNLQYGWKDYLGSDYVEQKKEEYNCIINDLHDAICTLKIREGDYD